MSETSETKPSVLECPFCGAKPEGNPKFDLVVEHEEGCYFRWHGDPGGWIEAGAIKDWNRRANDDR